MARQRGFDYSYFVVFVLSKNPVKQFQRWFRQAARHRGIRLPEAMCLSTVGENGSPEGRMVLLKDVSQSGFVFYTDTRSPKGRALAKRARAALTFYWPPLGRQVRVQGRVTSVSSSEADAYFRTRPRLSQIAAWASHQSEVLKSRSVLDLRVAVLAKKFQGQSVPRPPYWSGFRVVPSTVEFWQERPNRLHDRLMYVNRGKNRWVIRRLSP